MRCPAFAYLPGRADEDDFVDLCNYGPELSREVRGLTAWLPIKMHGIDAFTRCLDDKLDQADRLAEGLRQVDGMAVVPRRSPHLPVVAFQLRSGDEARNQRLCELVCSRGNAYLATTRLPTEGLVLRACILHHQTSQATIDQLLDDVNWAVATLRQEAT